jgi:hypothetical protein
MEMALAELRPGASATAQPETTATLVLAPLPRNRPDAAALGDGNGLASDAEPLAIDAEDAIAVLAARVDPWWQEPVEDAEAKVQLAFVAPEGEAIETRSADTAILAAFAVLDESMVVDADAHAPVARPETADDRSEPPAAPTADAGGLVFAAADLVSGSVDVAESGEELGDPAYATDEDALRRLIVPAANDQHVARFAMPRPGSARGLYTAPPTADGVAGLNEGPVQRADRFEVADTIPAEERGFLSRLFASLIE